MNLYHGYVTPDQDAELKLRFQVGPRLRHDIDEGIHAGVNVLGYFSDGSVGLAEKI